MLAEASTQWTMYDMSGLLSPVSMIVQGAGSRLGDSKPDCGVGPYMIIVPNQQFCFTLKVSSVACVQC